jgi:hypothetical protein
LFKTVFFAMQSLNEYSFHGQVHLSQASNVADHCTLYALSDLKEQSLKSKCSHPHDQSCQRCDQLSSAISELESLVPPKDMRPEDQDDMLYKFRQAAQDINAWKAHILRSMQQDKARTNLFDELDDKSIFITQDWAMKFLPSKYREAQTDWFAKRGISWHISVVVRKHNGKLQHQAMVHSTTSSKQDSYSVVWIIRHTLTTIKKEYPHVTKAFLRQDNAGCYHSVTTLSACRLLSEDTGIQIKRVDFSDPQGGKGPCDRKAATIKAHVRRYINEGHDVLTPADLKEAILSRGGVNGVRVAVVNTVMNKTVITDGEWKGISTINNFSYKDDGKGVIVWKAFDIGQGNTILWSELPGECVKM